MYAALTYDQLGLLAILQAAGLMILVFVALGIWAELRSVHQANDALRDHYNDCRGLIADKEKELKKCKVLIRQLIEEEVLEE